ncbi:hypothetical protein SAMN05428944_0289 [Streptomyces sp. 1222.5]|uniref:hypothetical protein n=1 Tax=unclassified Streptomyces TaxID=2593676 RepID=UPI00089726BB|nr:MULTISPECIES: hypothetical protein [unclassified Streptomyces]PKW12449.1 hypothetical protein BX260_7806 [Streptomyces sp. 5112.2]SEB56233.1 hypothetical protein SAMN05428944_0289 [Streptomyces sp. 1222.5]
MTEHVPDRSGPAAVVPYRERGERPRTRGKAASPPVGECLRPLTRCQVADRLVELGDLYADSCGGGLWQWNEGRGMFLRRLVTDLRRPGFALLIAESTTMTGYAYGFPVSDDGPRWPGLDRCLPAALRRIVVSGRLFAVSAIVVRPSVRAQHPGRDWNLARRLQRRLLTDHGAVLGVTLVAPGDVQTLRALRSWGWRSPVPGARATPRQARCRVLVLDR